VAIFSKVAIFVRGSHRRAKSKHTGSGSTSTRLRWEAIALASLAQTSKPVFLRAIKLGTSLSSHDHVDERREIMYILVHLS